MTEAPITLMQDGAWLVDQEGFRIAMPVTGGVYLTGTTKTLPELRALVAWMEQQEAGERKSRAAGDEEISESWLKAQAAAESGDLTQALLLISKKLEALRLDPRGPWEATHDR